MLLSDPPVCLPANPDISGIGVRVAIYAQNFLSFAPAFHALHDGIVQREELDAIETQALTILIMALAILVSAIIEATTRQLTVIHASIILNLSWMNNTNLFIYLVLYLHHKAGIEQQQGGDRWHWTFWWRVTRSVFRPRARSRIWSRFRGRSTTAGEEESGSRDSETKPSDEEAKPRRTIILLGTFHLSLMAGVGIWLWADPAKLQHRPLFGALSGCLDAPHMRVVGISVPITSSALRGVSLGLYSIVLLPVINVAIPLGLSLALYMKFNRARGLRAPGQTSGRHDPGRILAFFARCLSFQEPWKKLSASEPKDVATLQAFPIILSLAVLAVVNIVFLVDTELTISSSKSLGDGGEAEWTFGQTLALLLLLIPLRDVAEALQRRREKQEKERRERLEKEQRERRQREADTNLRHALKMKDTSRLVEYVQEGADPATKGRATR